MRKKNSEKIKAEYKTLHYFWNGLYHSSWKSPQLRKDDLRSKARQEIETHLFDIKKIIEDVYGPAIGEQILSELRVEMD